ncbi:hypothetical protein [Comamonas sp. MYb396]|uniref:hypothetical protein n=1 Tax=Comamonas sp. MYb396 TaxID=2745302 RepID=UPI0030A77A0A
MTARTLAFGVGLAALLAGSGWAASSPPSTPASAPQTCTEQASDACYQGFVLPGQAGRMHFYASQAPQAENADGSGGPQTALLIMHGHPRDANRSFKAALDAARKAGRLETTLVIAPLYQVASDKAERCRTKGTPAPEPGDALWTCGSWLAGQNSQAGAGRTPISAIAALDALVAHIHQRWPSVRHITLAGFSAGGQMLQRSIGFAQQPPAAVSLRYVVADPGTWLYFDPPRPQPQRAGRDVDWAACSDGGCDYRMQLPQEASCPGYHDWKYGTQALPSSLGPTAAQARERYRQADIHYLEGALDNHAGKGTSYGALDKSCAAMLQGPFRRQRGEGYAAYVAQVLQPARPQPLSIVPGCAHDVACVLPSDAARPALFGSLP